MSADNIVKSSSSSNRGEINFFRSLNGYKHISIKLFRINLKIFKTTNIGGDQDVWKNS